MNILKRIALVAVVVAALAGAVWLAYSVGFAKWYSRRINDIRQEYVIQDAGRRVAGYEWFYAQYNEIEATRLKAEIAKGTQEETGIRQVLASMIAEYNAKADSVMTVGQWRAKDLPGHIDY